MLGSSSKKNRLHGLMLDAVLTCLKQRYRDGEKQAPEASQGFSKGTLGMGGRTEFVEYCSPGAS